MFHMWLHKTMVKKDEMERIIWASSEFLQFGRQQGWRFAHHHLVFLQICHIVSFPGMTTPRLSRRCFHPEVHLLTTTYRRSNQKQVEQNIELIQRAFKRLDGTFCCTTVDAHHWAIDFTGVKARVERTRLIYHIQNLGKIEYAIVLRKNGHRRNVNNWGRLISWGLILMLLFISTAIYIYSIDSFAELGNLVANVSSSVLWSWGEHLVAIVRLNGSTSP